MPARIKVVELQRYNRMERYHGVDHVGPLLERVAHMGKEVGALLGTGRVWMLNSTATGGGVAEMLPPLCELLNEAGVDTRWLVLEPDTPEFFTATKSLHNMVHGQPPPVPLQTVQAVYDRVSREAAHALTEHLESHDVLAVHDPQPAGVALHLPASIHPLMMWRCHIGVPHQNEHSGSAWRFLHSYLAPYTRMIFSSERYIPEDYVGKSGVVHPAIDPLSHKNRSLRLYKSVGILHSAGLLEGPPVPEWARFGAQIQRYTDHGWHTRPIKNLLHVPVFLQVSRFDALKGFQYLVPAFQWLVEHGAERAMHMRVDAVRAVSELRSAVLLLAGPDPSGVNDDPEAIGVLEQLCRQWDALPAELAERVHILRLPMVRAKENALMVNAMQRLASVVVQNSVKEGFGLTVTEALWKRVPMVASNVGGISLQIRPGTDGLLVDDPQDIRAVGTAMGDQLFLRARAEAMATSGYRRVTEHFLVLTQVLRWLEELKGVLSTRTPAPAPPL